jgi:large subunit ribosomal protein L49
MNIPVYHLAKAGGNKHLTTVRKLSGDLHALQSDIRSALGLEQFAKDQQGRKKENVAINWTTRQIIVRGWRGPEIKKWAEMRGF